MDRFKNDLGRWRTLLDTSEQVMFDEFVRFVWDVDGIPVLLAPTSAPTEAEMCRFQELIQNLVSLDDLTDQSSARSGTRLKLAQRQMAKRKPRSTPAQGSRRPDVSSAGSLRSTASVLSRFTKDTDSSFGEKLDLSDFIYLDALEADSTAATPSDSQEPASPTNLWKNISPVVVLLLASVAFSVILTAVSGMLAPQPALNVTNLCRQRFKADAKSIVQSAFLKGPRDMRDPQRLSRTSCALMRTIPANEILVWM